MAYKSMPSEQMLTGKTEEKFTGDRSIPQRMKSISLNPLTFVFAVWAVVFLVAGLCFACLD